MFLAASIVVAHEFNSVEDVKTFLNNSNLVELIDEVIELSENRNYNISGDVLSFVSPFLPMRVGVKLVDTNETSVIQVGKDLRISMVSGGVDLFVATNKSSLVQAVDLLSSENVSLSEVGVFVQDGFLFRGDSFKGNLIIDLAENFLGVNLRKEEPPGLSNIISRTISGLVSGVASIFIKLLA